MKNIFYLLLIISVPLFGQKGKPNYVENVRLDSNKLKVTKDGIETVNGVVQFPPTSGGGGDGLWKYDQVQQSLWSFDAKTVTGEAGRWNFYALPGAGDSATNNSAYNVGIGYGALKHCANCKNNIAFGWEAGKNNKFGQDNVFISEDAGYSLFTGTGNNVVGRGALFSLSRGNKNDAFGYNALQALGKDNNGNFISTLFEENIAIGTYAGAWMNSGHGNIFLGAYAGEMNGQDDGKTITNSIYIGRYTGINSAHSGGVHIGYNIQSTKDNEINIGNTIKGDIQTGLVSVKALAINGREMWSDDNYIYVKTSTGVKSVALSQVTQAAPTQRSTRPVYSVNGQLIGFVNL